MERLLIGVHMIAARRGDGLLPELARALNKRCTNGEGEQTLRLHESAIPAKQDCETDVIAAMPRQ